MSDRADMYEQVTARIVAALESGTAPWVKPWTPSRNPAIAAGWWPRNAHTGKPYNGVNVLLLAASSYSDPRWCTYKQAQAMGGNVRKGEKGTAIVFWRVLLKDARGKTVTDAQAAILRARGETVEKVFLLRGYTVFNVAQCDGLDLDTTVAPELSEVDRAEYMNARGAAIVQGLASSGCKIEHDRAVQGFDAFYQLHPDRISVPSPERFPVPGAYWGTLLHECTHATGHASRCARAFGERFGDDAYAVEELVAELGSAFLCAAAGVDGQLQHASYLASWIRVLKADSRAIFTVCRQAQAASDWLLDRSGIGAAEEEDAEEAA